MGPHITHRLLYAAILLVPVATVTPAQNIAASRPNAARATDSIPADRGDARDAAGDRSFSEYKIGVSDVLHVNVWKNVDLSQTVTVDPYGFVSLPLLGDIRVAGLNTNELGTLLTAKYASYVVTPQVTVSVMEIRSRKVFVTGEVGKAGEYDLAGPLTVLQLLAKAGGLTPYAKKKDIYVLRASQKLPFNYPRVAKGDSERNIVLQPGDVIVVP